MDEQVELIPGREPVVRAAVRAFELLLRHGRPARVEEIAEAAGMPPGETADAVAEAAADSRLRLLADGRVHGSCGLDVLPTGYRLALDGAGPRYTWCAVDVLGIVGALEASGEATSTSPWTGKAIHLRFEAGEVAGGDRAVLFLAARPDGATPKDWCPSVNFFHDSRDALAWGEALGVRGRVLDLAEGIALAAPRWRAVLDR